jgi:hypothetical protein
MPPHAEPHSASPAFPEDRRVSVRHACCVPVTLRLRPWWLLGASWPATLCNASAHGLCLHTQRPQEEGTILYVELAAGRGKSFKRRLRAQVVHAVQTPVLRDWVLGCALRDDELTEAELKQIVS